MKWSLAHKQLVANDAKRPNIDLVAVSFFLQQLWRAVERGSTDTELGVGSLKNCAEAKVADPGLEVNLCQINCSKKISFLVAGHFRNIRIVRKVKQDVSQLHITMDNIERPDIIESLHNLTQDHANL